jgi:hypothetical protein
MKILQAVLGGMLGASPMALTFWRMRHLAPLSPERSCSFQRLAGLGFEQKK